MAIRGVFHAVPRSAFGATIRTIDDIGHFLDGKHRVESPTRLDVADAWACLGALCAHFNLPRVMGIQPLAVPGHLSTLYIPAYRIECISKALEQIGPGQLAAGMAAISAAPPADGAAWARDQRGLALMFLQLKKLYRACADNGFDLIFVKTKGAPGH